MENLYIYIYIISSYSWIFIYFIKDWYTNLKIERTLFIISYLLYFRKYSKVDSCLGEQNECAKLFFLFYCHTGVVTFVFFNCNSTSDALCIYQVEN